MTTKSGPLSEIWCATELKKYEERYERTATTEVALDFSALCLLFFANMERRICPRKIDLQMSSIRTLWCK